MKKIGGIFMVLGIVLLSGCSNISIKNTGDTNASGVSSDQGTENQNCPKGLVWNNKANSCEPDMSLLVQQKLEQQDKGTFEVSSGYEKTTFTTKDISFVYQKNKKTNDQLVEKNQPTKGIYNTKGGRAFVEFGKTNTGTFSEEYIKSRYFLGIDSENSGSCSIIQKSLSDTLMEVKIVPTQDLLKKYASDPSMFSRMCGIYSAINDTIFIYKKDKPNTFITVRNFRDMIDINSIILK